MSPTRFHDEPRKQEVWLLKALHITMESVPLLHGHGNYGRWLIDGSSGFFLSHWDAKLHEHRLFRVKTSELGLYTYHNYPLKPSKTLVGFGKDRIPGDSITPAASPETSQVTPGPGLDMDSSTRSCGRLLTGSRVPKRTIGSRSVSSNCR